MLDFESVEDVDDVVYLPAVKLNPTTKKNIEMFSKSLEDVVGIDREYHERLEGLSPKIEYFEVFDRDILRMRGRERDGGE